MDHNPPKDRAGARFDSAPGKAFNSAPKVEHTHRHASATRTGARPRIATWTTGFHDTHRPRSACGHRSPIGYEHTPESTPPLATTSDITLAPTQAPWQHRKPIDLL